MVGRSSVLARLGLSIGSRRLLPVILLMLGLVLGGGSTEVSHAQEPDWQHRFGSRYVDYAYGVATDSTGVYVVGYTGDGLPGQTHYGGGDAYIRKYDALGNELWTRQFGTSDADWALGVVVDSTGMYVSGVTFGAMPGATLSGASDAFLGRFDLDGNMQWIRQWGLPSFDSAPGIASDSTGVYVAGYLGEETDLSVGDEAKDHQAYARKYDRAGQLVWHSEFGTSAHDLAFGIAVDATGVYVSGYTWGALPGQSNAGDADAFVRKYDLSGTTVWTRQFGTPASDFLRAATVDATGVYVAGQTSGALADATVGRTDAFVRKYDPTGSTLWTRQFGYAESDESYAITSDARGVHITGTLYVPPPTIPGYSIDDAFIQSFDPNGNAIWTEQFGNSSMETGRSIATHGGKAYIVGDDGGDAFVVGYTIPASSSSDTAAPVGSVRVNDGATYTRTAGVNLVLSASDPMPRTGLASMRFSNDASSWSAWQSYSTTKAWTLSSTNGSKKVYAQYRDASGNVAATGDSITLDSAAPTVSGPSQTLLGGKQVQIGPPVTAPVKIYWSMKDATSGIIRYILQQSTDGSSYRTISDVRLSTPASSRSASQWLNLVPGHAYRYRVVAYDLAGNQAIKAGPAFRVASYQEVRSSGEDSYGTVSYPSGSWTRVAASSAYGGYVKYTRVAGKARFSFTGRSVAWVAPTSSTSGYAYACVDSTPCVKVDLSTTSQARRVVFQRAWSSSGQHVLEIRVPGGKRIDVDAFVALR